MNDIFDRYGLDYWEVDAFRNHFGQFRTRALALEIRRLIYELEDYWELTVRQVHYRCVSAISLITGKPVVENDQSGYAAVSRTLVTLREADLVPWSAIEDRTRRTIEKRGVPDMREFLEGQLQSFLDWRYYHRCYVQEQDVYVEAATEKDALSTVLQKAIWYYCTRLNVVKGQVSATMVEQMAARFGKAAEQGQECKLVYFGDLDPSGIVIPEALVRNMKDRHGVEVELVRLALNPDQVDGLPASIDAIKPKDPNRHTWLKRFGPYQKPFELDALPPDLLQKILKDGLDNIYDMSNVNEQKERERAERDRLTEMRKETLSFMRKKFPREMRGL